MRKFVTILMVPAVIGGYMTFMWWIYVLLSGGNLAEAHRDVLKAIGVF